jgi:hypothetical protein
MRASEFLNEERHGKLPDRLRFATRGLHTFTDTNYDRGYDLNRVMMAVACTDGTTFPDSDGESWSAKKNTAHPYSEVESKMLKLAYKAVGLPFTDLNKGDMESQEVKNTNTTSTLKPFKGYKKK